MINTLGPILLGTAFVTLAIAVLLQAITIHLIQKTLETTNQRLDIAYKMFTEIGVK